MIFGQGKRIRDAEARIDAQTALIAELDKKLDEILQAELSREDLYEKMRTLYARLNRRTQREEESERLAPEAAPLNPAALRLLNPYGNGR